MIFWQRTSRFEMNGIIEEKLRVNIKVDCQALLLIISSIISSVKIRRKVDFPLLRGPTIANLKVYAGPNDDDNLL